MKLCLYNSCQAGAVVGDHVYPMGDALVRAEHLKRDYTMADVIEKVTAYPEVSRFVLPEFCIHWQTIVKE
jgi:hypothetical protein